MNTIILLARQQLLLARRSLNVAHYLSLLYITVLFILYLVLVPYTILAITIPIAVFFIQNFQSSVRLRSNYEFDAGVLSVYPITNQQKFILLLTTDFFHINGLLFTLGIIGLIVGWIRHLTFPQFALVAVDLAIYWIIFSSLSLSIRTFSRRKFSYYYIIQFSGSSLIFLYFFFSRMRHNIGQIELIKPFYFVLGSLVALPVLYLLITRWFIFYLRRRPFADEELIQRFLNAKTRW